MRMMKVFQSLCAQVLHLIFFCTLSLPYVYIFGNLFVMWDHMRAALIPSQMLNGENVGSCKSHGYISSKRGREITVVWGEYTLKHYLHSERRADPQPQKKNIFFQDERWCCSRDLQCVSLSCHAGDYPFLRADNRDAMNFVWLERNRIS